MMISQYFFRSIILIIISFNSLSNCFCQNCELYKRIIFVNNYSNNYCNKAFVKEKLDTFFLKSKYFDINAQKYFTASQFEIIDSLMSLNIAFKNDYCDPFIEFISDKKVNKIKKKFTLKSAQRINKDQSFFNKEPCKWNIFSFSPEINIESYSIIQVKKMIGEFTSHYSLTLYLFYKGENGIYEFMDVIAFL